MEIVSNHPFMKLMFTSLFSLQRREYLLIDMIKVGVEHKMQKIRSSD